jgi:YD repeat-containing protein
VSCTPSTLAQGEYWQIWRRVSQTRAGVTTGPDAWLRGGTSSPNPRWVGPASAGSPPLTPAQQATGSVISYGYDADGNRSSVTSDGQQTAILSYNRADELIGYSGAADGTVTVAVTACLGDLAILGVSAEGAAAFYAAAEATAVTVGDIAGAVSLTAEVAQPVADEVEPFAEAMNNGRLLRQRQLPAVSHWPGQFPQQLPQGPAG